MKNIRNRALFILHTSFFILFCVGCSKLFSVDTGVSTGRGIVRRIDLEHHQVTLAHGRIPNLLNPMTYAYPVKSDAILKGVNEGDTVRFTIQEQPPGTFRVLSM